jgi:polysaccharide export outer membrane protein
VSHNPPSFSAVGAANRVGQYPFNMPKLFLSEAISMAGGLVDVQADTGGVYLFRAVPKITAAALFPKVQLPADEKPVHVALRLDLSSASGYVLAQQTLMRDKDLILLTNAKGTQLLKLFGLVRGVSAPIGDIRGSVQGARN